MTKKKSQSSAKIAHGVVNEKSSAQEYRPDNAPYSTTSSVVEKKKATESPSTSALNICRNKHWRYISCFHGPWLQLPPELLESLAFSNYTSAKPYPIDPAVFFDIAKVRRSIEESTDLAVRAASGTAPASLRHSRHLGNGQFGGGGFLGIGGNSHTNLSKERKHRMRELATQKLSDAYHRDEIAASVAAMQSASSVDEVAKLVLQRNGSDIDARYVNFFHEKIPSRMFAESTSLDVLDDIIRSRPADVALLRTRAVTRVFKGDLTAAAVDLSKALAIIRSTATQHIVPRSETGPLTVLRSALKTENSRSCNDEIEAGDEDRPSSLKPQLLFQRAGIYLALACQNIATYLDSLSSSADLPTVSDSTRSNFQRNENSFSTQAHSYSSEARKLTKSYAKRALRDYISFLSFLEYTPGFPATAVDEDEADSGKKIPGSEQSAASIRGEPQKSVNQGARDEATLPEALTPYDVEAAGSQNGRTMSGYRPPKLFPLSDLFAAIPPSDLPTYPVASSQIIKVSLHTRPNSSSSSLLPPAKHEAVTFHPLLIESLHAVLLCHSLAQTSPTEHLRHAHMVARLTRLCDGYPIFHTAKSPNRSDWVEVLRRSDNWIGLKHSWDTLCDNVPSTSDFKGDQEEETQAQARGRIRQEAIMDSLADERVNDEATFQVAVTSREREVEALEGGFHLFERNQDVSPHLHQGVRDEFPVCSERAEAIARWVNEAPRSTTWSGRSKRCGKGEGTGVMSTTAEART